MNETLSTGLHCCQLLSNTWGPTRLVWGESFQILCRHAGEFFTFFFYVFFSDLYLLSPVCHCWALLCGRSHPCLPDWRCLRCSQGVSWLKYISSPFLFAIVCFFSSKVYLLYANFIAGTPVTSASKAWSGLRPTLRIPSWSPSTLSILSRTSAWVSWEPTVRFVPKSEAQYSPGGGHHDQDACKQLVVEHFPAMHAMAMEKFFIPTEICMSEPVCGADPPTKPPGM